MKSKLESTTENLENKISSVKQLIGKSSLSAVAQQGIVNDTQIDEMNNIKEKVVSLEQGVANIDFLGLSKSLLDLREINEETQKY